MGQIDALYLFICFHCNKRTKRSEGEHSGTLSWISYHYERKIWEFSLFLIRRCLSGHVRWFSQICLCLSVCVVCLPQRRSGRPGLEEVLLSQNAALARRPDREAAELRAAGEMTQSLLLSLFFCLSPLLLADCVYCTLTSGASLHLFIPHAGLCTMLVFFIFFVQIKWQSQCENVFMFIVCILLHAGNSNSTAWLLLFFLLIIVHLCFITKIKEEKERRNNTGMFKLYQGVRTR